MCHQPLRVNVFVIFPLKKSTCPPSLITLPLTWRPGQKTRLHRKPCPFSHSPQREVLSIPTPNMFDCLSLSSPSNLGHACSCQRIITVSPKYWHGWASYSIQLSAPVPPAPRALLWPFSVKCDSPSLYTWAHFNFVIEPIHTSHHITHTYIYTYIAYSDLSYIYYIFIVGFPFLKILLFCSLLYPRAWSDAQYTEGALYLLNK